MASVLKGRIQPVMCFSCLVLLGTTGARSAEPARPPSRADAYTAGLECYRRLDFACAVELLGAARTEAGGGRQRTIDILRKLAESHLALGQREEAVEAFEDLLRIEPGYNVQPDEVSPKIVDALQHARRRLHRSSQAGVVADRATGPPVLGLGLGAGAELLIGRDRTLLEVGPVVELEIDWFVRDSWSLVAGLRYAFHDLSAGSSTLHLGGGWLGGGWRQQVGPARLGVAAGVGGTYFGIPDDQAKVGLLLLLRLTAAFPVQRHVQVGLVLAPSWIVTGDAGLDSSFTMGVGGQLCLLF